MILLSGMVGPVTGVVHRDRPGGFGQMPVLDGPWLIVLEPRIARDGCLRSATGPESTR
jgi:hypothetical protein